jgi:hypothetical protein
VAIAPANSTTTDQHVMPTRPATTTVHHVTPPPPPRPPPAPTTTVHHTTPPPPPHTQTHPSGGNGIPQGPGAGDDDADNHGAPSDGDGNI